MTSEDSSAAWVASFRVITVQTGGGRTDDGQNNLKRILSIVLIAGPRPVSKSFISGTNFSPEEEEGERRDDSRVKQVGLKHTKQFLR